MGWLASFVRALAWTLLGTAYGPYVRAYRHSPVCSIGTHGRSFGNFGNCPLAVCGMASCRSRRTAG